MINLSSKKLSTYELQALSTPFDLATAYPRQSFSRGQNEIIKKLTELYSHAHVADELLAKRRFEDAFFALAGQKSVCRLGSPLTNYSGSIAIEVIANYLRLHNKSVTLMQPTFDSLADTLRRHRITLSAIDESAALALTPDSPHPQTDALFIVCANNPTGRCPSKEEFTNIVSYCKKYDMLLIIDFCFRFYGDLWHYDQYQILQDSGIDFITTEDTGKVWPSVDVKLGMVLSSPLLYNVLSVISRDFLVSISPFIFELVRGYVLLEDSNKRRISSQDTADTNRTIVRQLLKNTPLICSEEPENISVEWVKLPRKWRAVEFCAWLHEGGVEVLPGDFFYWHDHKRGQNFIRIALLREPTYFRKAAHLLAQLGMAYRPEVRLPQVASRSQKFAASLPHNLS